MAILKKRNGSMIVEDQNKSIRQLTEKNRADLYGADLYGADLYGADLSGANLYEADLYGADLYRANLYRANLSGANFSGANLYEADISGANLYEANFSGADLSGANLYGANLYEANLSEVKIKFNTFPSIRLISSIGLGYLSPKLSCELMRWDAVMHPYPKKFNNWANGSDCPYQNEERLFHFETRQRDWIEGLPTMNWVELCRTICKEKGWKIKGVEL